MLVRQNAQELAILTEIYKDFKAKQESGKELSASEQKFMQDYTDRLSEHGLQMNNLGELEDIPGKKKKRK